MTSQVWGTINPESKAKSGFISWHCHAPAKKMNLSNTKSISMYHSEKESDYAEMFHRYIQCDVVYSKPFEGGTLYCLEHTKPYKSHRTLDNALARMESEIDPDETYSIFHSISEVMSTKVLTFAPMMHKTNRYYRAIFANHSRHQGGEREVFEDVTVWRPPDFVKKLEKCLPMAESKKAASLLPEMYPQPDIRKELEINMVDSEIPTEGTKRRRKQRVIPDMVPSSMTPPSSPPSPTGNMHAPQNVEPEEEEEVVEDFRVPPKKKVDKKSTGKSVSSGESAGLMDEKAADAWFLKFVDRVSTQSLAAKDEVITMVKEKEAQMEEKNKQILDAKNETIRVQQDAIMVMKAALEK